MNEFDAWDEAVGFLTRTWTRLLGGVNLVMSTKEWPNIFCNQTEQLPIVVYQVGHDFAMNVGIEPRQWWLPFYVDLNIVLQTSQVLVITQFVVSQREGGNCGLKFKAN